MPHRKNHHVHDITTQIAHLNIVNNNLILPNTTRCCVPISCTLDDALIDMDDLSRVVKVVCNNEHCDVGTYMHSQCFETWEETVLSYLRSCGRARSWSEKQRHQNLWTKKGYDLAFKACGCKCARGHLRKDLNWIPPRQITIDEARRRKKKKSGGNKPHPTLNINRTEVQPIRARASSFGSTGSTGSGSSVTSESPPSPEHALISTKGFFSDRSR